MRLPSRCELVDYIIIEKALLRHNGIMYEPEPRANWKMAPTDKAGHRTSISGNPLHVAGVFQFIYLRQQLRPSKSEARTGADKHHQISAREYLAFCGVKDHPNRSSFEKAGTTASERDVVRRPFIYIVML